MRVINRAVVVVALLAGCTYNGSRRVAEVGGYTIATGASVAAIGVGYFAAGDDVFIGDSPAIFFFPVAALLLASGVVLGTSGLLGMAVNEKPP